MCVLLNQSLTGTLGSLVSLGCLASEPQKSFCFYIPSSAVTGTPPHSTFFRNGLRSLDKPAYLSRLRILTHVPSPELVSLGC